MRQIKNVVFDFGGVIIDIDRDRAVKKFVEIGVKDADNLLDKIKAEIMKLSCFPKKHALIDEEPWRTEGIRKIVVKNFLIYYWVDDENSRVQVTAVIYSRRDQIRQLANMDMK